MRMPALGKVTITILSYFFTALPGSVPACGWWGDWEMNREDDVIRTAPDGKPAPDTLSLKSTKLPGRLGYDIAVPDPGRAVPYLQATYGRRITRIGELKSFGFGTVIDLGTPQETARLHRMETEAVGMRYISIPVNGVMPDRDQIERFGRSVIDFSHDPLLVYAPTSALLGTMWASYRISLGAPLEFAIGEGRALGMMPDQERKLRGRLDYTHRE